MFSGMYSVSWLHCNQHRTSEWCVLFPTLFTLYTNDCRTNTNTCTLADGTGSVGNMNKHTDRDYAMSEGDHVSQISSFIN